MLNEIERVESKQSALYKEVDQKIEELMEQNPAMIDELLELEGLFQDINIKCQADMYIAGYHKGRQMMADEMNSSTKAKPKSFPMFRRKKILVQAK